MHHAFRRDRDALKRAKAACRIDSEAGNSLITLGVAQYRVGQFEQALTTLSRSDQLNAKRFGRLIPIKIAFLAMTHHRLGHADEAKKLLARLRQLLASNRWKHDTAAPAFLREATSLIELLEPDRQH